MEVLKTYESESETRRDAERYVKRYIDNQETLLLHSPDVEGLCNLIVHTKPLCRASSLSALVGVILQRLPARGLIFLVEMGSSCRLIY